MQDLGESAEAGEVSDGAEREREGERLAFLAYREGLATQRPRANHVVQYNCHGNPKAGHSITTWCGWAGQVPEGHDVTPKPSRKKENPLQLTGGPFSHNRGLHI